MSNVAIGENFSAFLRYMEAQIIIPLFCLPKYIALVFQSVTSVLFFRISAFADTFRSLVIFRLQSTHFPSSFFCRSIMLLKPPLCYSCLIQILKCFCYFSREQENVFDNIKIMTHSPVWKPFHWFAC